MRYTSLDAVRGIASFMVLTHHCLLAGLVAVPPGFWTSASRYTPLHLFISGRPAVILFFVLSGFVLAVSAGTAHAGYAGFAVRRLCRIYLPYAFVVLLSTAAYWASPGPPFPPGGWTAQTWSEPAGPGLVLSHLLMPFAGTDLTLSRSAWSLVHEIRISLAFPLLLAAVSRMPWLSLAAAGAFAVAGWRWTGCTDVACLPYNGTETAASFGATLYFAVFFVLGILLAQWRKPVLTWLGRASLPRLGAFWAAAIYGMIAPFKFNVLPDASIGLASALLLALTLGTPGIGRILDNPALRWLGRVSFSLYLIHGVVLAAILRWGWGKDASLLLAAAIGLSLGSADLLYRFVERPCLRFGHWAAAWLARGSAEMLEDPA